MTAPFFLITSVTCAHLIMLFMSFFFSAYLSRRVKNWLRPSLASMHKLYTGAPWLWKVVNNVPFLQKAAMRYVYLSKSLLIKDTFVFNVHLLKIGN